MKMKAYSKFTYTLLLLLIVTGCGYHFSGQGNPFSEDIKTIAIPVFSNQTGEAGFENYLTNQLVYEFTSRKRLRVVDIKDADVVLKGKIRSINLPDISFSGSYHGLERKAVVTIEAVLEKRDGSVLWQDKDIIREEVYKVESSPLATESNKQAALHKIAADLAEMTHMRIFEDF
jgi:outer membrane lipopolysaccharide assembly protein LptE/RlpB